jgi:hypothetical protein
VTAQPPTWDSAITCADAIDLLNSFREYLRRRLKDSYDSLS